MGGLTPSASVCRPTAPARSGRRSAQGVVAALRLRRQTLLELRHAEIPGRQYANRLARHRFARRATGRDDQRQRGKASHHCRRSARPDHEAPPLACRAASRERVGAVPGPFIASGVSLSRGKMAREQQPLRGPDGQSSQRSSRRDAQDRQFARDRRQRHGARAASLLPHGSTAS